MCCLTTGKLCIVSPNSITRIQKNIIQPPMPYSDPEKQREAQRRWYADKYKTDRKFRARESKRKAKWLQTEEGRESNTQASARYRDKVKKSTKTKKAKTKGKAAAKPAAKKKK